MQLPIGHPLKMQKPCVNMRGTRGRGLEEILSLSPLAAWLILDENDCNFGVTNLSNNTHEISARAEVFNPGGFCCWRHLYYSGWAPSSSCRHQVFGMWSICSLGFLENLSQHNGERLFGSSLCCYSITVSLAEEDIRKGWRGPSLFSSPGNLLH